SRIDTAPSISEQAADWLVRLSESAVSEPHRRQFMEWLKKSPQNVEEFIAIANLHQEVGEQKSSLAEILAEVGCRNHQPAVPLFGGAASTGELPARARPQRRYYQLWTTAAGLALLAVLLLQWFPRDPPLVSHRTQLGEQRSVVLADGSIITLNTLSEAAVRFDRSAREVTLVSGEAMFDVVSDPGRPFIVQTGSVSLKVIGTRFAVYRKKNSTRVAVVDGVVQALPLRTRGEPLFVEAGMGAIATVEGVTLTDDQFDVEKAIAWTDRRLIFDGAPLAEVVAEFNRYNRTPLIVEDSALANRAITTVFNAHDVSALVAFLELEPDVEVQYGEDAIRIRVSR
ncbi:MAG TPA: FecR domain-containing protein, partial [Woeseiaceae bacterium]|nr:FecR domain-containing protein [Woeseiaceae bacterium]